jgi:putative addiction module CopG family antidote
MSVTIPTTLQPFVESELSSGAFESESALIATALEMFQDARKRHAKLKARVQASAEQAEAGEVSLLVMEDVIADLRLKFDESGQPKTS